MECKQSQFLQHSPFSPIILAMECKQLKFLQHSPFSPAVSIMERRQSSTVQSLWTVTCRAWLSGWGCGLNLKASAICKMKNDYSTGLTSVIPLLSGMFQREGSSPSITLDWIKTAWTFLIMQHVHTYTQTHTHRHTCAYMLGQAIPKNKNKKGEKEQQSLLWGVEKRDTQIYINTV